MLGSAACDHRLAERHTRRTTPKWIEFAVQGQAEPATGTARPAHPARPPTAARCRDCSGRRRGEDQQAWRPMKAGSHHSAAVVTHRAASPRSFQSATRGRLRPPPSSTERRRPQRAHRGWAASSRRKHGAIARARVGAASLRPWASPARASRGGGTPSLPEAWKAGGPEASRHPLAGKAQGTSEHKRSERAVSGPRRPSRGAAYRQRLGSGGGAPSHVGDLPAADGFRSPGGPAARPGSHTDGDPLAGGASAIPQPPPADAGTGQSSSCGTAVKRRAA